MVYMMLLFAALVSPAMASCPQQPTVADLDLTRFVGLWHTVREADIDWPGSNNIKCRHSFLHSRSDGTIRAHYISYNITSGQYQFANGLLQRASPDSTDGKLISQFSSNNLTADYTVIGTDYDNYAVTVWCRPRSGGQDGNIEVPVILSRQRTLDAAKLTEANALLPEGNYRDSNHDSCPEHDHDSIDHDQ